MPGCRQSYLLLAIAMTMTVPELCGLAVDGNVTVAFYYVQMDNLRKSVSLLDRAKRLNTESVKRAAMDNTKQMNQTAPLGFVMPTADKEMIEAISGACLAVPRYARNLVMGATYFSEGERRKASQKLDAAERAFNHLSAVEPQMKPLFSAFLLEHVSAKNSVWRHPRELIFLPLCAHPDPYRLPLSDCDELLEAPSFFHLSVDQELRRAASSAAQPEITAFLRNIPAPCHRGSGNRGRAPAHCAARPIPHPSYSVLPPPPITHRTRSCAQTSRTHPSCSSHDPPPLPQGRNGANGASPATPTPAGVQPAAADAAGCAAARRDGVACMGACVRARAGAWVCVRACGLAGGRGAC